MILLEDQYHLLPLHWKVLEGHSTGPLGSVFELLVLSAHDLLALTDLLDEQFSAVKIAGWRTALVLWIKQFSFVIVVFLRRFF